MSHRPQTIFAPGLSGYQAGEFATPYTALLCYIKTQIQGVSVYSSLKS